MIKQFIKSYLAYSPSPETEPIRQALEQSIENSQPLPFCPPYQGDLIYEIIKKHQYKKCLQTGFGTGSSALYMLHACAPFNGHVTSIDSNAYGFNDVGKELLKRVNGESRHTLIERASHLAISDLLLKDEKFDFIFADGWKTFDHLAHEVFIFNRILEKNGCLMFDDNQYTAVQKIISLLKTHNNYEEINYSEYGEPSKLRVFQTLTTKKLCRRYRALIKKRDPEEQDSASAVSFFVKF